MTESAPEIIVTPVGQPNQLIIPATASAPSRAVNLQVQHAWWKSKRFYGFVVAEVGIIGGMATAWAKGAVLNPEFVVTGIMALSGPLLALYGGIVADGPLGSEDRSMVTASEEKKS